jgi:hypothetical protein
MQYVLTVCRFASPPFNALQFLLMLKLIKLEEDLADLASRQREN